MDKFWETLHAKSISMAAWAVALLGNTKFTLTRPHRNDFTIGEAFSSDYMAAEITEAARTIDPDNTVRRRHREASILGAMQRDYVRRHYMTRSSAFATAAYSYDSAGDLELIHTTECTSKVFVKDDLEVLSMVDKNIGVDDGT